MGEKFKNPISDKELVSKIYEEFLQLNNKNRDFPGGAVVKNPPANAGVQSLVWEDPTCCGANEPVCHNYWSPRAATTEALVPRAHALQQEKPPQWEARAP